MTLVSHNVNETEDIAKKFANKLFGNEVVAFYGDLGVGKTTFIRFLVKACGSSDHVCSPTFSIMNEYEALRYKIYHFDMYRISSYEDLETTGFFDYLNKGLFLIEWSENIESELPTDTIKIHIEKIGTGDERTITFEGVNF